MKIHKSVTEARVLELVENRELCLDNPGICLSCGEDNEGCEPDARNYECESCSDENVFSAEEILLCGYYFFQKPSESEKVEPYENTLREF